MGVKQEKSTKKNNDGEKQNDNNGGLNTIILKFDMHCEGCAKKVRKSIKKLDGVEDVKTDCSTNQLVVTGKVDPVTIKEVVEEKMKRPVELLSLQPNKPAKDGGNGSGGGGGEKKSDGKKPEEKKSDGKSDDKKNSDDKKKSDGKSDDNKKKPDGKSDDNKKPDGKSNDKKKSSGGSEKVKEKLKEIPFTTVQLKTKVHCEGCSHKIKRIVSKFDGVQDVNVDLQKDMITAKGTMNTNDLLPYLNLKLKRVVELAPTKKEDKKPKEGGSGSEKPKEGGGKSEKPKATDGENKEGGGGGGEKKDASGDKKGNGQKKNAGGGGHEAGPSTEIGTRIEVSKMEYSPYGYENSYSYTYDPRQQGEGYGHQVAEYWHAPEYSQPPQMFSDENPNACSIM